MATNDVNLQVINSMTQDKMNSLKDADGKIPSLANQIIATDEEDANFSCLRTEVIYDRLDPNKNLNKPDGIMGNVNVVIDLSKYAYIEVVPEIYNRESLNTGGWSGMYKLDLTTKKPNDSWNVAGYSSAYADDAQSSDINKVAWNFSLFYQASSKTFKWLIEFGGTSYNQNSECFISKIYGVLKEPAMIYTGAELHEGDGISINNGVVSQTIIPKARYIGGVGGGRSFTGTSYSTVQTATVTTKGGRLFIYANSQMYINANIAYLNICVDGTTYGEAYTNRQSMGTIAVSAITEELSAGVHTVLLRVRGQQSGNKITLPEYNGGSFVVVEV